MEYPGGHTGPPLRLSMNILGATVCLREERSDEAISLIRIEVITQWNTPDHDHGAYSAS
jgi:hypothetical protein